MIAVCCAVADAAIARGRIMTGTMLGSSAWVTGISNARAVVDTSRIANIHSRVSQPIALPIPSRLSISTLTIWQFRRITRRS